jgi:hypothetical protein
MTLSKARLRDWFLNSGDESFPRTYVSEVKRWFPEQTNRSREQSNVLMRANSNRRSFLGDAGNGFADAGVGWLRREVRGKSKAGLIDLDRHCIADKSFDQFFFINRGYSFTRAVAEPNGTTT